MQAEKFQSSKFRERLSLRLEECGMTQLALAKAAGISHATISNYLRGARTSPRAEEILALARVLRVTMEWLLGVEGEADETMLVEPTTKAAETAPQCTMPVADVLAVARHLREQAALLEERCGGESGKTPVGKNSRRRADDPPTPHGRTSTST